MSSVRGFYVPFRLHIITAHGAPLHLCNLTNEEAGVRHAETRPGYCGDGEGLWSRYLCWFGKVAYK